MGRFSGLIILSLMCQASAGNLRSPRNLLQMTMSEEDEPIIASATPVVTAAIVPVAAPALSSLLAEPEPLQVAPEAVVPVAAAVLTAPEPVAVAPVPIAAPVAVLAEPEPAQTVAAVPVVTAAAPAEVPVPVAVAPAPVAPTERSIVSAASSNGPWAAAFSKHTTDEALLALFDVASQLKTAYLGFDVNGDGTVDNNEISGITNPSSSLRRLMELATEDLPEQVVATAELPPAGTAAAAPSQPKLNEMFDLVEKLSIAHTFFDADGDGAVSASDLIKVAKGP